MLEGGEVSPGKVVTLSVVTDSAVLYVYHLQNLSDSAPPTFALEDECHLLERK